MTTHDAGTYTNYVQMGLTIPRIVRVIVHETRLVHFPVKSGRSILRYFSFVHISRISDRIGTILPLTTVTTFHKVHLPLTTYAYFPDRIGTKSASGQCTYLACTCGHCALATHPVSTTRY